MKPERWEQINDLFQSAVERAPEERVAFLEKACRGDEALWNQVKSLIACYEPAEGFIESPAFEVLPELLTNNTAAAMVGALIGHYHIESLIGVGGMGEVYLARDEQLGRKVALKFLPERLTVDKTQLTRFKSEARTASALNHPNILTVYEIGAEGTRHFIATEFIEGTTLRGLLARGRMSLQDALEIAVQVASALAAAHESGVVHRDIKPENIMVRPDGYAKVLDFGIAKLIEPEVARGDPRAGTTTLLLYAQPGLVIGTAQYMSPEQARGQTADARSDIWSLGVVLYEMVAGNPPFSGTTPRDCTVSILNRDPRPLSGALSDVPLKLESIVQRALRKDRNERYQTIGEMLADLRDLRADLGTESFSPRAAAVVSKVKRHKRLVSFALAAAILVAMGLSYHFRFGDTALPPNQKSIAVLPFADLSQARDQEYFCDGIQEEILTRLSKIADIKVISRTSTQRFKSAPKNLPEIAKQLGVINILEGTVQKTNDQIRVNVQLINARNDSHLWAEKYDRKLTDVFGVESEIAKTIAETLRAKLSGSEQRAIAKRPTQSSVAHQLYLKGTFFSNKRTGPDLRTAIEHFKAAIDKDPNYALAYAGLADAYALLSLFGGESPLETVPQAKRAAKKALELDDTLPEAHNSLGLVLALYDYDFAQSKKEFERAIELNPNYATAHHQFGNVNLSMVGEFDRAIAEGNRAAELDPLSLIINADLGQNFMLARRYDEAIDQLRKTLALDPRFYYARWTLGEALQMKGQLREAMSEYEEAAKITEDPHVIALLAQGYARSGQPSRARDLLSQIEQVSTNRHIEPFTFALAHLAVGDNEKAIDDLEQAFRERDPNIVGIKVEPLLDPLRGHPRFERLIGHIHGEARNKSVAQPTTSKSIAVLPFKNLSSEPDTAYFADGVQEEILTRLAKIGTLRVISRTSTEAYKSTPTNLSQVAEQLGVANFLEGSVQKAGKRVRVNAQLIKAEDGSHLWAETYDRKLIDIFAVESEVAAAIADKLQATLSGNEERVLASKPTTSLDAYDAYLHGLEFDRRTESPADLLEAKRYLELAVKLDPRFALAWARLGRVEANVYFQDIDISPARREAARNAVEMAVRLQPELGESWLGSGYYRFYCERNLKRARADFENARQRLPNNSDVLLALSFIELSHGRPNEALPLQARALQLDPRNTMVMLKQTEGFVALRRFAEARTALDQALTIAPSEMELMAFKAGTYQAEGDLIRAAQMFGQASAEPWSTRAYPVHMRQLMFERRYAEMIARLGPLLAAAPPNPATNHELYYWLLGMAQRLTGDLNGAQSTFAQGRDFLLRKIQKSGGPQGGIHAMIALMYAGLGDKLNALREANLAIELEGDDTYMGPSAEEMLAIVEVQTGEKASAIARLAKLLKSNYFSWVSYAPLTLALLRIDPVWDPLRDDRDFQKLIEETKL